MNAIKYNRIENWESIEEWKNYVEMKIELKELKAERLNLQGMIDDRTKELKQEVDKRELKELEEQQLNLQRMVDDRTKELKHEVDKRKLKKDLEEQRLNLQGVVDDKTKELKREVDKRKRIELEVAKLERLNVIGQLAAGLGHEVRNPMTTIRGFLQMLQNKTDLLTYKSYFELMIGELDRTNTIITDFLSLAKSKPTELKRQCLNKLLANLFPLLLADAYSQDKKCIFEPGDLADLEIDTNEITQLVLNFVRNGLEAMENDRCLKIRTFIDGQNIVLSIKDEGTGIKPEHISKLGTPFFTTKEGGTGLGLPMCYNIAERHNATIEVKTSSGGTTFLVRFPQLKGTN